MAMGNILQSFFSRWYLRFLSLRHYHHHHHHKRRSVVVVEDVDPPDTIFIPAHKVSSLLPAIRTSNISQGYFYDKIIGRRGGRKKRSKSINDKSLVLGPKAEAADGVWQETATHLGATMARWAALVCVMMLGMSLTKTGADIKFDIHY